MSNLNALLPKLTTCRFEEIKPVNGFFCCVKSQKKIEM